MDLSHYMEKQGPRAQVDRNIYKQSMQNIIFGYPNLDVRAASVFDLVFDHGVPPSTSTFSSTWGTVTGVRLGARATNAHTTKRLTDTFLRDGRCDQVLQSRYLHWNISRSRDSYWYVAYQFEKLCCEPSVHSF